MDDVGPYVRSARAACAEAGTDYCDLTGEVLFVHRSIADNHETACRTGARIVRLRFDSSRATSALLTAEAARADGADLGRTHLAVRSLKGGFSGGTIDSARTQVDELRSDAGARRVMADRWALADGPRPPRRTRPGGREGFRRNGIRSPVSSCRACSAASPGPHRSSGMPTTVTSPVRSSWRRSTPGSSPGPPPCSATATTSATSSTPTTAPGRQVRSPPGVTSVVLGLGFAGLAFPPTRALLDRVLPKPGEGPGDDTQATGRFRMEVTAEATNGRRYRTTVGPTTPGTAAPR